MRTLAVYLPAVACVAMMLFLCIPMMRNMHRSHQSDDSATREEVAELRDEVARLKAERSLSDRETVDG